MSEIQNSNNIPKVKYLHSICDVTYQKNSWSTKIADMYQSFCDNLKMSKVKFATIYQLDLVDHFLKDIFASLFGNGFGFIGSDTVNLFIMDKFDISAPDTHTFTNDKFVVMDNYTKLTPDGAIAFNKNRVTQLIKEHPHKKIILPVCVGQHIVTVYINPNTHSVCYYDPQGFNIKPELKEQLLLFANDGYEVETLTDEQKIVPHDQQNRTDCGVICIKFMEHLLDGEKPETFTPTFQKDSKSRVDERVKLNERLSPRKELVVLATKQLQEILPEDPSRDDF